MLKRGASANNSPGDTPKLVWKRRPSEIRGYQTALYLTTESGDYIRIDYNLKEKKIRAYIEDGEEGGNPYYLVVVNDKITVERNATTGRQQNVVSKLAKRGHVFASVSNKEVNRTLRKILSLPDPETATREKKLGKRELIEETKKRYFQQEDTPEYTARKREAGARRNLLPDLLDIMVGVLLCVALYMYLHNFVLAGLVSAFYGIIIGMIDMFLRQRSPSFIKMLMFIIGGLAMYVYEYYLF
jgi:hypothetical protein